MVVKRIIPDAYTEYEDGHLGVVPASLANVEAKIGQATGGIPGKVYTLAGPDAKKLAKTIFKSGPLLEALEEAFDAGSTRIHAVRIGSPEQADLTLSNMQAQDTLKLKGDYGTSGNSHYVNVMHALDNIETGFAIGQEGAPTHKVVFYDGNFDVVREVELEADVMTIAGVGVQQFPVDSGNRSGFWVLGDGPGVPTLWHYSENGGLIAEDTIDLSASIPPGDMIAGIVQAPLFPGDGIQITTDKHMLSYILPEPGVAVLVESKAYSEMETPPTAVGGAVIQFDVAQVFQGEEPQPRLLLLDTPANKIFGLSLMHDEDVPDPELGAVDISDYVGDDEAVSIGVDLDTGEVLLGIHSEIDPVDRVSRLAIDWGAEGGPTAELVEADDVGQSIKGMGAHIASVDCTTTVKIQDRNMTPYLERSYSAKGGFHTVTPLVADAINGGGVYSAELLLEEYNLLAPSMEDPGDMPDPTWFEAFTGGDDGGDPTNGDYLDGLDATVSKTDTNWIHAVEATSNALWSAILLHCAAMLEDHQSERFAILETPEFESNHDEGSADYLADLQTYVENIVSMAEQVGDRNAVIFAGGAEFMGSDGENYDHSITAACGGTMARLEVQKSLINKPVRNVLKLVPEFSVGHIQTLIQARVNCIRFKPGRGYILAHSLTAAAEGSDYSRANDLRAVYYGSKAAREAAQPYVGEENDSAGEGLRRLESAMSRPLELMRDGGQIDDFDLVAVSTANDRLLGDVYVKLGIQPRRAMEMIYTTVYLK